MAITIPGRVVVFDYGEVISIEPTILDRAELTSIAGFDGPQFWGSYWYHRDALDRGTATVGEYWARIGRDLGALWTTAQVHRLWLTDFRSWLAIDPQVLEVLIELQEGGTRMALLSNAGPDFASYYRHGMIGDFFERVLTSGELGLMKPSPEIYLALVDALGVPADRIVFIDNKEENVRGAEAVGIEAHHFTSATRLREQLVTLSGAPSATGEALL
jgi:putative hydrolase of the HAD superfamily